MESDGTPVDDDMVLNILNRETFLLLTKDEDWNPVQETSFSLSTCSTETLESSSTPSESPLNGSSDFTTPNGDNGTEIPPRVSHATWEEFEIAWHLLQRSVIEDCEKSHVKTGLTK